MHCNSHPSAIPAQLNIDCECPELNAPMLVANFIHRGLESANKYQKEASLLMQEWCLRRTFYELLNRIADPLVHPYIRQQCLDQLYKPLIALKRFYKAHHDDLKSYLCLEQEMRVICNAFNPHL